jgi:polyphosphate kinase 2 (PPK2 family)
VRVRPELLAAQHLPGVDRQRIWAGRFESIRGFERHLARNGIAVVKFWLNISHQEQKKRLLSRIDEADRNWKFRLADLDDRSRWKDFQSAYEVMLQETSREWAPWHAIPADDKPYMRVAVARVMVETLRNLDPRFPELGPGQRRELEDGRRRLEKE